MEITNQQADIRFAVGGKSYFEGSITAYDDGNGLTASTTGVRTGAMGRQKKLSGASERAPITLTIPFDDVVAGFHNELENHVRAGTRAVVSIQWLNRDRTAIPAAHFTNGGPLQAARMPSADGNATLAAGMYTVIIDPDE